MTTPFDWRAASPDTLKLLALAGDDTTRVKAVQELFRRVTEKP
jgi:hypothetical protein